jgi:hypothetical protein
MEKVNNFYLQQHLLRICFSHLWREGKRKHTTEKFFELPRVYELLSLFLLLCDDQKNETEEKKKGDGMRVSRLSGKDPQSMWADRMKSLFLSFSLGAETYFSCPYTSELQVLLPYCKPHTSTLLLLRILRPYASD